MKRAIALVLCGIFFIMCFSSCSGTKNPTPDNTTTKVKPNPASDFIFEFSDNNKYALINQYIGKSKNVVIPSTIEGRVVSSLNGLEVDNGIIQGVFENTEVNTVVIPETVRNIGNAFSNCASLSIVTIKPDSELYTIGAEAFENCTSLKEININDAKNLKTIGAKAFYNCSSIERIDLPINLESVGVEAFGNCTSLKSVTISSKVNLMNVDGSRFTNVPALNEITFEDGWQTISGYMFFYLTSEVSIKIPSSVKSIDVDIIKNEGSMKITFMGDCPELLNGDKFDGNVTIYYDANTQGWDTTPLKNAHTLIPQ